MRIYNGGCELGVQVKLSWRTDVWNELWIVINTISICLCRAEKVRPFQAGKTA